MVMNSSLAICIPTYKRSHLLGLLIEDLTQQTVQPDSLIIVDGDPDSGDVRKMMSGIMVPDSWKILYVPSNHPNVAYQRYLGWRAASQVGRLIYLDDDMRIAQPNAIERLLAPLGADRSDSVVGVTATVHVGNPIAPFCTEALKSTRPSWLKRLIALIGSSRNMPPGSLSAAGEKKPPRYDNQDYTEVQSFAGGVMAFEAKSLSSDCFPDSVFAMFQIRAGMGEDVIMSYRASFRGKLLHAFCAEFEHPSSDLPKAYPNQARRLAYARAYSRRCINDHFREDNQPRLLDRWALARKYVALITISWLQALPSFKLPLYAYALGTLEGAFHGIFKPPTAKRLTPDIDWWDDAEEALASMQIIS